MQWLPSGREAGHTPSIACLTLGCVIRPWRARFSTKASFEAPDDLHAIPEPFLTADLDNVPPILSRVC